MSTNCLNWSLASSEAVSPVMASYPAGSTAWIPRASCLLAHPGVGGGADGGEAVRGVEDPLRRRGGEGGERGAREAVLLAEGHDPDQAVLGRPRRGDDAHAVADREVLVVGRRLVDDDVVGRARGCPGDDPQRVQIRVVRPVEAQRGGSLEARGLAVLADDLGGAEHGAFGRPHAVHCPDRRHQRGGDGLAVGLGDRLHPAHLYGGSRVGGLEDAVERLVDRVAEDEGAHDEADAEHDREGGQEQPEPAGQQVPDGLPEDRVLGPAPMVFM